MWRTSSRILNIVRKIFSTIKCKMELRKIAQTKKNNSRNFHSVRIALGFNMLNKNAHAIDVFLLL